MRGLTRPSRHRPADAYHTLYCLSGLSAAQHHVVPLDTRRTELLGAWSDAAGPADAVHAAMRRRAFVDTLSWAEEEGTAKYVGGAANRVNATHPLANLTVTHAENMMAHFYAQKVPRRGAAAKAP